MKFLIKLSLIAILFSVVFCSTPPTSHGIELDDGQKWQVNAEMVPHIESGQQILEDYLAEGGTDYQALSLALQEENSKLIKSCTMTGASHDELHKWLHPHMQLISDLETAPDYEASEVVVAKLQSSFETYAEYFE